MQTLRSIETSGTTRQMTQRHVAGELNPLKLSLQSVSLNAKIQNLIIEHRRTPLIRINWDRKLSEYAENSDNLRFSLKIGYIGSLKLGCYCLH
jgi:hypothetical protein